MALVSFTRTVTENRRLGNNSSPPVSSSKQATYMQKRIPDSQTKGTFITFPDGSKFRRATNLSKSTGWIEPGEGQRTTLVGRASNYNGGTFYIYHSPGGYDHQLIFNSTFNSDFGNVGGFKTMYDAPSLSTNLRNNVITNALNDIADQKAGIGENLATFRQVMSLFVDPGKALTKLVKELHHVGKTKRYFPYLRKSLRDIRREGIENIAAQEYLKYVYGWKPLMQDIFGTIEVAQQLGNSPLLIRGRANASEREDTGANRRFISEATQATVALQVDTEARCTLWAQVDPDYQGTRALNQLGLLNPISLLWELVPWSFVVDWVLPIGPVLQALTAPAGLKFVNGSVSARVSCTGRYSLYKDSLNSYIGDTKEATLSRGNVRYEGYSRDTIVSWPKPGFYYDSDPLRGDRGFKAIALSILQLRSLR